MTSLKRLHNWWHKKVTLLVKHIVTTFALIVVILVGNQVQVQALADENRDSDRRATYQVAVDQYNACLTVVDARLALRAALRDSYKFDEGMILFLRQVIEMSRNPDRVDPYVVLIDDLQVQLRNIQIDLDKNYPPFPQGHCGDKPVAPEA